MSMRTPLSSVRGLGAARSGTSHFWLQRLTAIANLPLIFSALLVVLSLLGQDYATVSATLGAPLIAILLILAILSISLHMKLGMQTIIEDYIHNEAQKFILLMLNIFFCVAMACAGIFAIMKISFGV